MARMTNWGFWDIMEMSSERVGEKAIRKEPKERPALVMLLN